ncbi:GlsB/YeaQ/YmgE family stress response membrane protein [Kutzneria viridogrisea]|uniref:GlsB/YeaQ/YmgE family stress response membrane protein n=2 Tax=Kutzneria TaxID=43356 RepID=W5WR60_9PSEU|nr:GlsB/YeaQ/YmgE family stress response membrane protein [Kutzneria albida]AHI00640.1 hypothetical protein KALB_7282 [Kutzneria albida DSM 43870]MBA8925819.1 putative membrane protein YeaQ/YmgE (transglycosylase-associated protein family) [Kutzneria viridogrisea]
MGIIAWIVLGLIVGAIAKAIMPGKDGGGLIITMLLGVVGGFVGGIIGKALFGVDIGGFFEIRTWLLAILGAVIVLGIYRLVTGRKSHA